MAGAPNLFMAFSGSGNAVLKSKQRWWEDPTYMKVEQDETFEEAEADGLAEVYKKIMKFTGALDEED